MKYKIVKGYVSTFNGKEKTVWNVVDENDGFIMDTFSLKRDAKLWIYCHEWNVSPMFIRFTTKLRRPCE